MFKATKHKREKQRTQLRPIPDKDLKQTVGGAFMHTLVATSSGSQGTPPS